MQQIQQRAPIEARPHHQVARNLLQCRVDCWHAQPHSAGVIDETSFPKQGRNTACVQRQYCGSRGKVDNCMVGAHLG